MQESSLTSPARPGPCWAGRSPAAGRRRVSITQEPTMPTDRERYEQLLDEQTTLSESIEAAEDELAEWEDQYGDELDELRAKYADE